MTQVLSLTGLGMAPALAQEVVGSVSNTLTATGSSSQANSFAIANSISIFTTAAGNSGARLPLNANPGNSYVIANYDSNTMLIYPPTGGKLNAGTLNTGSVSLTTLKSALCISINGLDYIVIVSA